LEIRRGARIISKFQAGSVWNLTCNHL
jgi:hypothetical protein